MSHVPQEQLDKARTEAMQLLMAGTKASNAILGLDSSYSSHRAKITEIIRSCGAQLSDKEFDDIEEQGGITAEDKQRWDMKKWNIHDYRKLLHTKRVFGKVLSKKLTDAQVKCIQDKVRRTVFPQGFIFEFSTTNYFNIIIINIIIVVLFNVFSRCTMSCGAACVLPKRSSHSSGKKASVQAIVAAQPMIPSV